MDQPLSEAQLFLWVQIQAILVKLIYTKRLKNNQVIVQTTTTWTDGALEKSTNLPGAERHDSVHNS